MLGSFWSSAHRNPAQQEFEQQENAENRINEVRTLSMAQKSRHPC